MPAKFRAITPKLLPTKVFTDNFQKAARLMEADVKAAFEDATSHWKTKPTWRGYVRIRGHEIYISVGTNSEIFKYVDLGTKAHFVKPVNAKVLHWVDARTGEDRFSKGHEVKGIEPRNISKNIQDIWAGGLMAEYFDDALLDAVQQSGHAI